MKLVTISDTHGYHDSVKLPDGDILIHAGDFTGNHNNPWEPISFLHWFNKQPYKYKILIAGNHDVVAEKDPALFKSLLEKDAPSIIYLQDSGIEIEGLKFWGSPFTPRFFNWAFNEDRGKNIKRHWDLIPNDIDILITHGPASGICDGPSGGHINFLTGKKEKIGCLDLLNKINSLKLKSHIFGHIHCGYGSKNILINNNWVKFINSAICNEAYKPVNHPWIIEI